MKNNKTKLPFIKSSYNHKWEDLCDIAKEFDYLNLKNAKKFILKNTDIKKKKNLFVILCAIYLEDKSINWNNVKKKIYELEKTPYLKKKNNYSEIIDKEKLVEIYINIGKENKVFPNNIINFINHSMKIRDDQIKDIKIFDNYSFFKIPENLGEKALILLSLKKYKGKKVVVNYAKKK